MTHTAAPRAPIDPWVDVLDQLRLTVRLGRQLVARPLHRRGLGGGLAIAPLALIAEHGPMRLTALAELIGSDPSVVSRQTAELTARGHLDRTPDPSDRRACVLELTTTGRELLHEVRAEQVAEMRSHLQDWSDGDAAELAALLTRLTTDLRHSAGTEHATGSPRASAPAPHPHR